MYSNCLMLITIIEDQSHKMYFCFYKKRQLLPFGQNLMPRKCT